jgi:hypothetical protein
VSTCGSRFSWSAPEGSAARGRRGRARKVPQRAFGMIGVLVFFGAFPLCELGNRFTCVVPPGRLDLIAFAGAISGLEAEPWSKTND